MKVFRPNKSIKRVFTQPNKLLFSLCEYYIFSLSRSACNKRQSFRVFIVVIRKLLCGEIFIRKKRSKWKLFLVNCIMNIVPQLFMRVVCTKFNNLISYLIDHRVKTCIVVASSRIKEKNSAAYNSNSINTKKF